MTIREHFWRWLHRICEVHIRDLYLVRTGWDLKCPHCQTWSSIGNMIATSWNDEQTRYNCRHCGKESAWEFHGPAAISVPIKYWPNRDETKAGVAGI